MIGLEVFTPGGLINFFTRQHHRIGELCLQTLASCGPERQQAFFMLRRLLAVHRAAETLIVGPRIEGALPNGNVLVQQRQEEHRIIADAVGKLERLSVDTDQFIHGLELLYRTLTAQAQHEEHEELAALRRETLTDDLDRIARTVAALESIESGDDNIDLELTHFLVGSYAAMNRRADDIIAGRMRPGT